MPADRRRWHGAPARGRRPLARGLRRGRPRGVRTGGAQQLPVGPGPEAAAGRHPLVAEPGDDPPRRRDRDAPRPVRPAPVSERAGAAEPVSTVLAAGGTATTVWAVETSGDDRTDHGLGEQGGLGPGDAWVERTLHEDGVPDAEHEHRPDLSGVVGVLAAVLVEQLLGVLQIQQLAGAGAGQDVPGPVVHLPAQPDPDRRGEGSARSSHAGGCEKSGQKRQLWAGEQLLARYLPSRTGATDPRPGSISPMSFWPYLPPGVPRGLSCAGPTGLGGGTGAPPA